jgi:2-keto-3-deoxy-6-phosphogluconate aldolase
MSDVIVGAGDVIDVDSAGRCLDIGAAFLTGPALDLRVIEFAAKWNVLVLPGALTPTEVISAWRSGADLVKVFPCTQGVVDRLSSLGRSCHVDSRISAQNQGIPLARLVPFSRAEAL